MVDFPLLRYAEPERIFAWVQGQPVSVVRFLASAETLASTLPERRYLVNLCTDRYHFLLVLVAAMLRKQVVLLPANRMPHTLRTLANRYPSLYALHDNPAAPPLDLEAYPLQVDREQPWSGVLPVFPGEQLVVIAFTSGSTGEPQAQPKSWRALVTVARNIAAAMGAQARTCKSLLATVPAQHMYGLEASIMLPLQQAWVLHSGRPFFPADLSSALEQLPAPSLLVTTPVHLRACCEDPGHYPAVASVLSATAPLSDTLAQQVEDIFGAALLEIYGCSEAGSIAMRRTVQGNYWQALAGITIEKTQQDCQVRAPYLPTAIPLSDVLRLHSPTHFSLYGRQSDLVNMAGKRSSIAELDRQLNAVQGVQDGAYFMPDEQPSAQVTRMLAFVVAPKHSTQDILAALRERVDEVFLPRPLYRVSSLPRSETGKLPRARLMALAKELAQQGQSKQQSVAVMTA